MDRRKPPRCWFTRRDGVVRGPFSIQDVSRYILLGRISVDDEISDDRQTWQNVKAVADLLPPELQELSSWEDYQQLIIARMQIDERRHDRRATGGEPVGEVMRERRRGTDRREEDGSLSLARYFFNASESVRPARVRGFRLGTLILTIMLAVLVVAWLMPHGS